MKAKLKSGAIIEGEIAALFVKIGVAEPFEEVFSAAEVVQEIKNCKTIEDLELLRGDERKTVQAAFEKRFKELT